MLNRIEVKMKIVVIGAGQMSRGLIFDFLKNPKLEKLFLVDFQQQALDNTNMHFNDPRIISYKIAADDLNNLKPLFTEANGVVSAVPYDYNLALTKLAIESKTHFVDLGGNNSVVDKQFQYAADAKAAGIGIIPDCGLAPGMVSVLAAHLINKFARVDSVKLRVGGLPVNPKPPGNYQLVFSVHGLINEYIEAAQIIEDGEIKSVPSMSEVEELEFPKPFGFLEAFYTSGGTSTLPQTFKGSVTNLDYKTIRYPGHCHIMKAMIDLGFSSDDAFIHDNKSFSKRSLFEHMLQDALQSDADDVILIRATASGVKSGSRKKLQLQAIEYGDKKNGLTAMMRTTAFPAAIVLQMLINSEINDYGVLKQEVSIPTEKFIQELEERDIRLTESEN